jgi:anti-anti-sigma factor
VNAEHRLVQRLLWSVGEARRHRPSEPVLAERPPERVERPPAVEPPPATIPTALAPLELSVTTRGAQAVLSVVGELDGETAPAFLRWVHSLADEGVRSVVIDLGGAHVGLGGVDALANASASLARRKAEMVLRSPRSNTLKLLDLAGLGGSVVIC